MATKTTTTSARLYIGIDQSNGKTRYINIPNPLANVDESAVKTAMANFTTNSILLDEATGEPITDTSAISTAYTNYSTVTSVEF